MSKTKEKLYTIKEIAQELNITREYLHMCLKPFKKLFKAPGNIKTALRKTKYTAVEREMIFKFYDIGKNIRRNK